MNITPRTDAAEYEESMERVVSADFARQIEWELYNAQESRAMWMYQAKLRDRDAKLLGAAVIWLLAIIAWMRFQ